MKRIIRHLALLTALSTLLMNLTVGASATSGDKYDFSLLSTAEAQLVVYVDDEWSDALSGNYGVGNTATVTAPAVSGKAFSHWEADGSVISYSNPLKLTMNAHITLFAVYADTAPEAQPTAGFTSVTRTNDGTQISFQAIADGTVNGAGIVYSATATGDALTIGGDEVTNVTAERITTSTADLPKSVLDGNNCWTLQITPDNGNTVYHARAYVTTGGEPVYGDVKDVKLSALAGGVSLIANLEGFRQGTNETLASLKSGMRTVTYNANGGIGATVTQGIFGSSVTLRANTFIHRDCIFKNWNTAADGSGTTYTTGQNVSLTANLTLYAQWEEKPSAPYTVPTGLTAVYGQTLADVTLPTGWAWADSATSVGNVGTHTFKASFTPADTANYKAVSDIDVTVNVFAAMASVDTDPTANTPIYDGTAQALVTAGTASGGTMKYALGEDGTTAPDAKDFAADISTGTDAGEYYVWYKAAGDANHADSTPVCVTVTVARKTVTGATVTVGPLTYTGKALTPAVTVVDGETTLLGGRDFSVSCGDTVEVKDVGDYTATVTFTGNYSGTASQTFRVQPYELKSSNVVASVDQLTYTGSVINPDVVVRVNSANLTKGTDYTVSYSGSRTNAGDEVTVTVTGKGNFKDSVEKSYSIAARSLADAVITVSGTYAPTGSAIVPPDSALRITLERRTLVKDTDFDVAYSNNVRSGEAVVTVTGKGNYFGTAAGTFDISGYNVFSGITMKDENGKTISGTYTKEYDGNQHWLTVSAAQNATVTYSTEENGTYSAVAPRFTHVRLNDGKPAGTTVYYKLSAEGYKTVSGSVTVTVTPATATLTWGGTALGYNGLAQAPTATVSGLKTGDVCDANITVSGEHASAGKAIATGSYTATVAANGLTNPDYKLAQTASVEFTIAAQSLANATVIVSPASQPFTGSAIEPKVIVKNGGVTLKNTDYSFAYTDNTYSGTASVSVTGTGNYTGTATANFTITKAMYPYSMTVSMADVNYGETENPTVAQSKDGTLANAQVTPNWKYSTSPSGAGTAWSGSGTLNVGTYYVWAEVPATGNYSARQSERVRFSVTKATPAAPAGVLTDTANSYEMAVNIPDGRTFADYEYSMDGTNYSPLPKLTDGSFTPAGTGAGQTRTVSIRLKGDANHNPSAAATATLTTPTLKKLTLDAQNGAKQTVIADEDGNVVMPENPVRAGYTFVEWNTAQDGKGGTYEGAAITNDTTVYAQWTANSYSVAYHADAEDASGSMENKSFVYGAEPVMLTDNSFTRTGYTFCGWATASGGSVVYTDKQAVANLTSVNDGVVDLYAVWVRSAFKVTGTVAEEIDGVAGTSPVSGVTVRLMRGDSQIGSEVTTDASGAYSFSGVPSGTYNIVATRQTDSGEQTVTALVTVDAADAQAAKVTLPPAGVNSVLEVGSDAPAVMVGGLDDVAKDHAEADKDVTLTMTVEKADESAADAETKQAVEEIKNIAESDRTELDYLEIKVEKEVTQNGTKLVEESGSLSQTSRVMEIIIPFKTNHRSNFSVFRSHEGKAEALRDLHTPQQNPGSVSDGWYYILNNLIHIFSDRFSTYAVGYEEGYTLTVVNGTGDGDYAEGATVTITANAAPSGQEFDKWTTSDGVTFVSANSATTTFTMPARNVTVTANYKSSGSGYNPGNGSNTQGSVSPSDSSSDSDSYLNTVVKPDNGTVSVNRGTASNGEKVTITVKPDTGYAVDTVTVSGSGSRSAAVTKVNDTTYTYIQPGMDVKINVTFKPVSGTDALAAFSDVNASDWYADAVRWAVENGVMNGVGGGIFNPNGETSRGMVVTMLWRLEGSPAHAGASEFADVKSEDWYGQAVRWASAEGIVTGYEQDGGKVFNPNGAVTREQLATMLYRYAQHKGQGFTGLWSFPLNYPDAANVSEWAYEAMCWMTMNGVINGIDGKLAPASGATRAQVATMLMRYCTSAAK